MQRLQRSLLPLAAVSLAFSLQAAPRDAKPPRDARRSQVQQKQAQRAPWARLIQKILDDIIPPPPDNRGSIPPP